MLLARGAVDRGEELLRQSIPEAERRDNRHKYHVIRRRTRPLPPIDWNG